jgi:hypothetical protein
MGIEHTAALNAHPVSHFAICRAPSKAARTEALVRADRLANQAMDRGAGDPQTARGTRGAPARLGT